MSAEVVDEEEDDVRRPGRLIDGSVSRREQ